MSRDADGTLAAVILAGGAGRRVGGADKGLLAFRGALLIEHALAGVASAGISRVVVSANRNLDRYSTYGARVVRDDADDLRGPLAGIVAAMAVVSADFVYTVPVDVPNVGHRLPNTLLAALREAANGLADVAVAHDGAMRQPLFAVYRSTVLPAARAALLQDRRSVRAFQDSLRCVEVRIGSPDDYRNLNAPEQYA